MNFIKNMYRRVRNFIADIFSTAVVKAIQLVRTVELAKAAGRKPGFTDYLKVVAGAFMVVALFLGWAVFVYSVVCVVTYGLAFVFGLIVASEVAVLLGAIIGGIAIGLALFDTIEVFGAMLTVKLILAPFKEGSFADFKAEHFAAV